MEEIEIKKSDYAAMRISGALIEAMKPMSEKLMQWHEESLTKESKTEDSNGNGVH